jgi:hypothetical protein
MPDGSWGNDPIQSMGMDQHDAHVIFDKVFGVGKWKSTGGYRTPQREDELRAEGAQTVPPGHTSAHSEGTPDAPGAYDIVVDGMSPSEAAEKLEKSGYKFTALFPEGASGSQGGHLHVAPSMQFHDDWGNDPVVTAPKPTKAATDATAQAVTAGEKAAEEGTQRTRPTPLQQVASNTGHVLMEGVRGNEQAQRAGFADLTTDPMKRPLNEQVADAAVPFARPAKNLMDMAGGGLVAGLAKGAVGEPVVNALKATVGDPVKSLTGGKYELDPGQIGNMALMAAGGLAEGAEVASLAGRARTAGVAPEALQANEAARTAASANTLKTVAQPKFFEPDDPTHAAAVKRLEDAGVRPAQFQRSGGQKQRFFESLKADPYVGPAIRAEERQAGESFNRALYNKVLAPTGERLPDTIPVGRDGVAAVERRLGDAYDRVLPHVRLSADKNLTDQLADIRTSVAKLGAPQEQQFEAILNQDVLHHFTAEGMDGRTFKKVESDLLRQSRNLKGSPDPNARGLGYALDDTLDALRQDMVDHSPAKYRKELQNLNQSYAMFTRLQDAATARKGGAGEITPGDLLGAVKKGDRSVRKGSFARGDALLQDFAEDADRVLSPRHGTSHTPEIQQNLNFLRGHGVLGGTVGGMAGGAAGGVEGAAIGSVVGGAADIALARLTNLAARRALSGGRGTQPANYLRAVTKRPPVAALAAPGSLPTGLPTGGAQQQP